MSGQRDNLHVPDVPFTPQRPIPTLPTNVDGYLDQILASPQSHPSPSTQPTMATAEQQIQQLRELAEAQQQQLQEEETLNKK